MEGEKFAVRKSCLREGRERKGRRKIDRFSTPEKKTANYLQRDLGGREKEAAEPQNRVRARRKEKKVNISFAKEGTPRVRILGGEGRKY